MTDTTTPPAHVDLDPIGAQLATYYRQLGDQIADLEAQRKQLREQLELRIGDAPEARVDGRPVIRWAWSKPVQRFDRTRFAKEHPDLFAEYYVAGQPQRRFVLVDDKAAT